MNKPHQSVLLEEVIEAFKETYLHTFIDGTLGAGGHSEAILKAHPEIKRFIGIDQDKVARAIAKERLSPWKEKVTIVEGNFSHLSDYLKQLNIETFDGILFDLGVSSMQLDMPEKGFSFMREGPLDMRMDEENPLTAEEIVNTWKEEELAKVFRDFGDEKKWRFAAKCIVEQRMITPFKTTTQLANFLSQKLFSKKPHIHPATLIFQALRIAVNDELKVIQSTLPLAIKHLAPKGRMAVISFHSLEDLIVKTLTRFSASDKMDTSGLGGGLFLNKEKEIILITKKPIMPSEQEIANNPRSRSAKLRIIEKC